MERLVWTDSELNRIYLAVSQYARDELKRAYEEHKFARLARENFDEECARECDAAYEQAMFLYKLYKADAEKIKSLLNC